MAPILALEYSLMFQIRCQQCPWPLAPITNGVPLQTAIELEQIVPFSWHFNDGYVDFDLLRQLREQGVQSLVFTVNDIKRVQQLRQQGIAGIFTDIPSKMAQID
jgi:glycerophosphoryl diester phosphodiesterase